MTDEPKKPEDDTAEDSNQAADNTGTDKPETSEPTGAAAKPESKPDSDPLPETEERTAEFVEEEAVRGDFVLRWAIVLLAMMLGFTQTDDSRALVHVKSGEYMQANGFLPPRVDVFSASAKGESWVQLSWLFDHVSAFMQALPGSLGFTLITTILAGLAFGYAVHTALPRVSTWWTTICMAFALLAAYPRFTPTPELITLAFTAMTLCWLYKWQTSDKASFPIRIPILFLIWANCDPRMWIGVAIIALYALGHAFDRMIGRYGWTLAERSKQVWLLLIACVVASLANPFIHESLLAPVSQYTVEYPSMREYNKISERQDTVVLESTIQYYGMLRPAVWTARHKSTIAGAIIILVSLTFFIVNLKHMDTGYLLVLLGLTGLAAFATHELAVAALVAAVLAGLNGQDWFRHNFRNEYTTDTKTFVFSQGGRALTVVGIALFAFLGVSGRLTGPNGVRIGYGIDPNLSAAIEGTKADLEEIDPEAGIFNFTPEQGDILIYTGYKPFLDSRLNVFGNATDDLVDTHIRTRAAFRLQRANVMATQRSDKPDVWKKTLADYELDYVAPRLYASPGSALMADYGTYKEMLGTGRWSLDKLGSALALFHVPEAGEKPNALGFVDGGLRTRTKDVPTRLDWARAPSIYDEYLFIPKKVHRLESQKTQHYREQINWLSNLIGQARSAQEQQALFQQLAPELTGACYLTLQNANKALAIDGNDARAYRALGDAHFALNNLEQKLAAGLRYRLAISAYRQSLRADPTQSGLFFDMFRIYQQNSRPELALEMLDRYLDLAAEGESGMNEQEVKQLELQYRARTQLRERNEKSIEQVTEIRLKQKEQLDQAASDPPTPEDNLRRAETLVEFCTRVWKELGLSRYALSTLEDDPEVIEGFPPALFLYARLLLENGDLEESNIAFMKLDELSKKKDTPVGKLQWQPEAATVAMIAGEYERARDLWNLHYKSLEKSTDDFVANQSKLALLPFLRPAASWPECQTEGPIDRLEEAGLDRLLVEIPSQIAAIRFQIALSMFEEGNGQKGADLMRQLVDKAPDANISQLARFYYTLVKNEELMYDYDYGYVSLDMDAVEEEEKDEESNAKESGKDDSPSNDGKPANDDKEEAAKDKAAA